MILTLRHSQNKISITSALNYLQEVGRGSTDWIDLAQDRGRWRAHVNSVINLQVCNMWGM